MCNIKNKKGIFLHFKLEGKNNIVEEIEKKLSIDNSVIRYLTVKQDGPLPTPRVTPGNDSSTPEKEEKEEGRRSAREGEKKEGSSTSSINNNS